MVTTSNNSDELISSFRQYCRDRLPPRVSAECYGYIRHCLAKAAQNAEVLGVGPRIYYHPTFALMALEAGDPQKVVDFLEAISPPPDLP
jgi:hypothetical protein